MFFLIALNAIRHLQPSTVCIVQPFYGQNGNRIITIANAIRFAKNTSSTVALDKKWSAWYNEWFDGRDDILFNVNLNSCKLKVGGREMYWMYPFTQPNSVLKTLTPSNQIKENAAFIYGFSQFISVHRRHHPACNDLNALVFCHTKNYKTACNYTEEKIRSMVDKHLPIILFTDGGSPLHDNTFAHKDNQPFQIQMWGMTMSKIHFGNPLSSIDYIVAHWRKGRRVFPTDCKFF